MRLLWCAVLSSLLLAQERPPLVSHVVILSPNGQQERDLIAVPQRLEFPSWSSDGKSILVQGDGKVYRIPVDGPPALEEVSAVQNARESVSAGKWTYFHSQQGGNWNICRKPTGAEQPVECLTSDAMQDWFPHPSPDGKYVAFLSYPQGTQGSPSNKAVELRLIRTSGSRFLPKHHHPSEPIEIKSVFGGRGTLGSAPWSPDGKHLVFISYGLLPWRPNPAPVAAK